MEKKNRDFLIALSIFVFILFIFDFFLFHGLVNSFGATPLPHYQAIRHIWEMAYQEIPVRWTAADIIRSGHFPAWTPYAEAGTPLIGKMQNGIFYPFHIFYYLASRKFRPWAFSLVPILSQTTYFAFLYIFARLLGLPLDLSILAGSCAVFSTAGSQLSPNPVSALFLPALLALAEIYRRSDGRTTACLWLAPPITALSFFAGHFETAFRISAMADLYLAARCLQGPGKRARRLRLLPSFAGAQALGGILALVQILPGMEYVHWSYNQVWRTRPEFGWIYHTIQKHLTWGDFPLLALGIISAAAMVAVFLKIRRAKNPRAMGSYTAAGAVALGLCVAALSQIGLDATADGLFHGDMLSSLPREQYSVIFLLLTAFISMAVLNLAPEFQALEALLALGALIQIKFPPVSNLLASLPITRLFDNTQSSPELTLSACFLSAAALDAWRKNGKEQRLREAGLAALCILIFGAGAALSGVLSPFICRIFPTGISVAINSQNHGAAFMGPEKARTEAGTPRPLRGLADFPCISAEIVGILDSGKIESAIPAQILPDEYTCSFYGLLPLPPVPVGDVSVAAKIILPDGSARVARGPVLSTVAAPIYPALMAAASIPAAAIFPFLGQAIYAASALSWAQGQAPAPVAPKNFPLRFPGIKTLQSDASLFRIDAFDSSFLEADYANLYGLSDIRNGGDNLDVLPAIYFNFLVKSLLASPNQSPDYDTALKLLGLAGVKYLIAAPEFKTSSPHLKETYRGDDMAIYRNDYALPRAAFFGQAIVVPISNILNWDAGRQLAFGVLPTLLRRPGFDPEKTLVLNDDSPNLDAGIPTRNIAPAQGKAEIVSYEPNRVKIEAQASKPGYVFLSDNDFPGWIARVNGQPAKIIRAFLTFRAVAVPAGKNLVVFSYWPRPLIFGAVVSALGFVLWIGLFPLFKPLGTDSKDGAVESWALIAIKRIVIGMTAPAMIYWIVWALLNVRF
ncbi:MAG: YfhO family protein [Elusimicrobiota bacterium]